MKIEITLHGSKYVVEREKFKAETAFDDFLNLLFIAGVEVEDLQKIIETSKTKQNHKKDESKRIQNSSHL